MAETPLKAPRAQVTWSMPRVPLIEILSYDVGRLLPSQMAPPKDPLEG